MSDKLKFRVSSGIKDIVGKDLITDDNIAVFELVKNSYDAHASHVVIEFQENKIIISDNGKGMSLDDIKNKWLYLAFSAKKDDTEDLVKDEDYRDKVQAKTHYAGAKGVGRFSVDRLGKTLTLTSSIKGSKQFEQIKLDWDDFNDQYKEFGKIGVTHNTLQKFNVPFPNRSKHGVILEIEGIANWDRAKIIELKQSLEKLINPFSETDEFSIKIVCEHEIEADKKGHTTGKKKGTPFLSRERVNGTVENSIKDVLALKTTHLKLIIDSEGITTEIKDRGSLIYKIKEKNDKYKLLEDFKIDLYFLNQAAKLNFTKKMGVSPVNYGNVFLFKNGFRVQPYGRPGDDSWGLDYRAQQGVRRFLGTRSLFGRVDITTDNSVEFKEVSSRDGGMVNTDGYKQLYEVFKEKGLKRLERYVVGVLWGEGFKRKNYFVDPSSVKTYRDKLKREDQDSEDISGATQNIGSKIDFVDLINGLAADKSVEIIDFNKDFVDMVNAKFDDLNTEKYFDSLKGISENLDDPEASAELKKAEDKFAQLIEEKREAEEKAEEEERLRKEAEEEKARIEEELRIEKERSTYLLASQRTLSNDAKGLIHNVKLTSKRTKQNAQNLYNALREDRLKKNQALKWLSAIVYNSDKALKISNLITRANFKANSDYQDVNVIKYIEQYFDLYRTMYEDSNISFVINADNVSEEFVKRISILDLSLVLDDLISNSDKAGANKIQIDFSNNKKGDLIIDFSDNGKGLDSEFIHKPELIFGLGVTTTDGSGIGLDFVRQTLKKMKGQIEFSGNEKILSGACFRIVISKSYK